MDKQEKDNNMHICAGLLAHVDAGKTTLSEAMLYRSGSIRNLGRVDHQNAFLDYDELERNRGITIYAKQAALHWKQLHMNFCGYTWTCRFQCGNGEDFSNFRLCYFDYQWQ